MGLGSETGSRHPAYGLGNEQPSQREKLSMAAVARDDPVPHRCPIALANRAGPLQHGDRSAIYRPDFCLSDSLDAVVPVVPKEVSEVCSAFC